MFMCKLVVRTETYHHSQLLLPGALCHYAIVARFRHSRFNRNLHRIREDCYEAKQRKSSSSLIEMSQPSGLEFAVTDLSWLRVDGIKA